MTIRIEPPLRTGGAMRIVMPVAELTVAEIALERGRYVLHFHPTADKLSGLSYGELESAGRAEVARLNKLVDITKRLKG